MQQAHICEIQCTIFRKDVCQIEAATVQGTICFTICLFISPDKATRNKEMQCPRPFFPFFRLERGSSTGIRRRAFMHLFGNSFDF